MMRDKNKPTKGRLNIGNKQHKQIIQHEANNHCLKRKKDRKTLTGG